MVRNTWIELDIQVVMVYQHVLFMVLSVREQFTCGNIRHMLVVESFSQEAFRKLFLILSTVCTLCGTKCESAVHMWEYFCRELFGNVFDA